MEIRILNIFLIALFLSVGACQPAAKNDELQNKNVIKNESLPTNSDTSKQSAKGAMIVFDEEKHDFGEIIQGEKVSYSFRFVNKGTVDLIISTARGSCGCTVPKYTSKPIKPGTEEKIDVVFDSENLLGLTQKTVIVVTNSYPKGIATLTIQSSIVLPQDRK